MEKRLSKFDYFVSLIIILLLVANVGSFFFGVQYGADEMETKYLAIINKDKKPDYSGSSYHQQHIVSYYHTVFQPLRTFEIEWFNFFDALDYEGAVSDPTELIDTIQETLQTQYKTAERGSMPASSPFLVEAQSHALKSMKLFEISLRLNKPAAATLSHNELQKRFKTDPNYVEARNFALKSRQMYFAAIVEWNKTINNQLKGTSLLEEKNLTIAEWKTLNLNLKNQMMAQLLTNAGSYTLALPHDYVSRVDEMIRNGQINALKIKSIAQAITVLNATKAVRNGDFVLIKEEFYGQEFLPNLPFFSEVQ